MQQTFKVKDHPFLVMEKLDHPEKSTFYVTLKDFLCNSEPVLDKVGKAVSTSTVISTYVTGHEGKSSPFVTRDAAEMNEANALATGVVELLSSALGRSTLTNRRKLVLFDGQSISVPALDLFLQYLLGPLFFLHIQVGEHVTEEGDQIYMIAFDKQGVWTERDGEIMAPIESNPIALNLSAMTRDYVDVVKENPQWEHAVAHLNQLLKDSILSFIVTTLYNIAFRQKVNDLSELQGDRLTPTLSTNSKFSTDLKRKLETANMQSALANTLRLSAILNKEKKEKGNT